MESVRGSVGYQPQHEVNPEGVQIGCFCHFWLTTSLELTHRSLLRNMHPYKIDLGATMSKEVSPQDKQRSCDIM